MALRAEALAVVIDVSPSMSEKIPGEQQSPLEKSITAASMVVQRKIFANTKKNKDEACLILFGTEGTSHPLNEGSGEGYEHITLAQDLRAIDLNLLMFVNQHIQPGVAHADFLDALVVAVDHLRTRCLGRKMDQKIILFSDMTSEFDADQLDMIVAGMKANNVNLIFVGPEIDEDDDERPGPSTAPQRKPLTQQQTQGINCIRRILDLVDGEGMSISEVLPMLSFFEKRRKKQVTAFRGPIEIGSTLKINSYAYVKTSEEKADSWKKLSARAETAASRDSMAVQMVRTYHHRNEQQTEVEKEDTGNAYRYGQTLVPLSTEDEKTIKLDTTKGCLVLGFTSQDNIERSMFSRNGCHIFVPEPGDQPAAVAFSALCRALEEKNMVAIVRYVSRGNTDPKVGFLTPHIKARYESLIFVALPYREDVRNFYFPPLDNIKPPSDESVDAMDNFIDSMMLCQSIEIDGEKEVEEQFKPKDTMNPIIQRQFQCIQSRAMNPDEISIPDMEQYIARSLIAVPEMVSNSKDSAEILKKAFPLKEVEKKGINMFQQGVKDAEERKTEVETNDEKMSFSSPNRVTEVGTSDPVTDFDVLIQNADTEKFNQVSEHLKSIIMKLVLSSILSQYFSKALQALKHLRSHAVKRGISKVFNALLGQLKEETCGKRKDEFWQLLKKEKILPMDKTEGADSTYSTEEVVNFYEKSTIVEEKVEEQYLDDEDDLLDMM